MKRVCFYIDGFNVYHAIDGLKEQQLKWLDLSNLAEKLIHPKTEVIERIYYFSAFADFKPDAKKRHEQYVAALRSRGIEIVMGNFKRKTVYAWCDGPGHKPKKVVRETYEEKESDVNVALQLVSDAYENVFDVAYIVSSDSDLVPAMRMVLSRFPQKRIVTVAAPHKGHSQSALKLGLEKRKINREQLSNSMLPDEIKDEEGRIIVRRPDKYK